MSVDGTKLLFEGFLQKRKDTLKIRWVTYWFRLQNTALFFYTEKNGSASHLRGYYYIYTVQSVREVKKTDRKHFMFEIIMTNGKRKMLAAETAALRRDWVRHLWQAMHLSSSGLSNSSHTQLKVCEQQDRLSSSTPICSHGDDVMELPPARPLSAPAPSFRIHHEAKSTTFPVYPYRRQDSEEATYQNILLCSDDHSSDDQTVNDPQSCSGFDDDGQEGVYDILPRRKDSCALNPSVASVEDIYDCPRSYRSAAHQDATDSIYDVPSCLLRKADDHAMGEQSEEGIYWTI